MADELSELKSRFGDPQEYKRSFIYIDSTPVKVQFTRLHHSRYKLDDNYEDSRQQLLKSLSEHEMIWYPVEHDFDLDVKVSRVNWQDQHEYIAFMRIGPKGYRGERLARPGIKIIFHVLIGEVTFTKMRRTKTLYRGQHIAISSRSTYSLRCLNDDQPAYLIFKMSFKSNNPSNN